MLWGYHTSSETGSDKSRNISVTTDTWGKTISTVRPFHLLIFFLVPKWTLQNTDTCATYSLAFFAHHCAGHLSPKDVVNKVFECSIFLIVCKQTITQLGNTTYIIMNIHNNTYTYIYMTWDFCLLFTSVLDSSESAFFPELFRDSDIPHLNLCEQRQFQSLLSESFTSPVGTFCTVRTIKNQSVRSSNISIIQPAGLTLISSALIPSSKYRRSSWLSCCWKPLNLAALK